MSKLKKITSELIKLYENYNLKKIKENEFLKDSFFKIKEIECFSDNLSKTNWTIFNYAHCYACNLEFQSDGLFKFKWIGCIIFYSQKYDAFIIRSNENFKVINENEFLYLKNWDDLIKISEHCKKFDIKNGTMAPFKKIFPDTILNLKELKFHIINNY